MRVESESPTALARGRAEIAKPNWISENNKGAGGFQGLSSFTEDLEAVADFYDDLRDQIQFAWAMTPKQFARLERGLAAFNAFTRLCDRQQERRAM